MLLTSLCLLASLNACDAMPTAANEAGAELAFIAVGDPSFAKGAANPALTALSPSGAELRVGETVQLVALDANGNPLFVKWSSNNVAVAMIDPSGLVTAVGSGSARLTAQQRNQKLTAPVIVAPSVTAPNPEPEPEPEPEPNPEPNPDPEPEPDPPPATPIAVACTDYPHARTVQVSTASQLTDAVRNAQAGDLILLADGTYTGRWTLTQSGTSSSPVVLCGERGAVLQDTRYDGGAVLLLRNASNWVIQGFTVRTALWGVRLEGSSDNRIIGLLLHDIGQEAIGLKLQSSRNIVQGNRIYDTGRRGWNYQQWGEGIYVGSYSGQWVNGQVDRSDHNQLLENQIGPNVTAEHIDVKEGTTGTIIRGNTFDGRGMENNGDRIDSWVLVQGNEGLIENNRGTYAKANGFRVWPGHDGNWGQRNTFRGNVADVQAAGYGFIIQGKDNIIACANTVTNAASGFANVPCS